MFENDFEIAKIIFCEIQKHPETWSVNVNDKVTLNLTKGNHQKIEKINKMFTHEFCLLVVFLHER